MALREYKEVLEDMARPIQTVQTRLLLSAELWKAARKRAIDEDVSATDLVSKALTVYLSDDSVWARANQRAKTEGKPVEEVVVDALRLYLERSG